MDKGRKSSDTEMSKEIVVIANMASCSVMFSICFMPASKFTTDL